MQYHKPQRPLTWQRKRKKNYVAKKLLVGTGLTFSLQDLITVIPYTSLKLNNDSILKFLMKGFSSEISTRIA